MTNANLPERWLNDMRFRSKRLSDAGYRSYMNALMWSVANRTEGIIERGDLEDIPDFNPAVVPELMGDDLWEPLDEGDRWLIYDFATTQTGRDLLEKYEREKALDRARKARKAKAQTLAKLADEMASAGNSTGNSPVESPSTDQTRPDPEATKEPKGSTQPPETAAETTASSLRGATNEVRACCARKEGAVANCFAIPDRSTKVVALAALPKTVVAFAGYVTRRHGIVARERGHDRLSMRRRTRSTDRARPRHIDRCRIDAHKRPARKRKSEPDFVDVPFPGMEDLEITKERPEER